jgi:hypothetical protein
LAWPTHVIEPSLGKIESVRFVEPLVVTPDSLVISMASESWGPFNDP